MYLKPVNIVKTDWDSVDVIHQVITSTEGYTENTQLVVSVIQEDLNTSMV